MKINLTSTKSIQVLMFLLTSFVSTHALAQTITGFTLVNADTDVDLFQITNGQNINFQELPTANLNIRAGVSGSVGSISFFLNGSFVRTESVAPYALAGDTNGNYASWSPGLGTNLLKANVYSGSNATGTLVETASITITFVDEIIVTDVQFINCPTSSLLVGDAVDLDVLITPSNATNQAIVFIASDDTSVNYSSGQFTARAAGQVTVTATSMSNGSVSDQCVITILDTLTVSKQSIARLILVDADSDLDITPLQDGDILNFFYLPSSNLNVRAETNPAIVGSVGFEYDGNGNFATENGAPYALAGDAQGNYKPWTPTLGTHTLTVTPYTASARGGEAGISTTINFTVIDQDTTVAPPVRISGELKKWHKVTLSFEGNETSETAADNPFANYRLMVTFSKGGKSYTVPGFYAADGETENTSSNTGNIWQVHFTPDETGTWSYIASFRNGNDVAISTDPNAGTPISFDGKTGMFDIAPSDKTGRDFRNTGRLEYVGQHYLRFAESGEYFFKVGADAPENTFAYEDFDATPNKSGRRKSWAFHARDFDLNDARDYTWGASQNDGAKADGRELLGALKYLSDQGMNVFSFLTFSLDGDDGNVYPHLQITANATDWANVYHDRFDVSKLAQWEKILEYADKKGIYIHFKTQETENDLKMDGGLLGRERKLYYRELIARFGHHLALNWNLGEENDIWEELNDPNNTNVKAYAQYIEDIDPYDHNIVIHTYPGQEDEVFDPLLGSASKLTGASIQTGVGNVHNEVKKWVRESNAAGKKWIVANDEQGEADSGVAVDTDYPGSQLPEPRNVSDNRTQVRHQVLWGTLMSGGAGVEYYYGYQTGCDDLDCQDHRTRQTKWNDAKIALNFFNTYLQPYITEMANANGLTADNGDYVFAQTGNVYAIYRPSGGTTTLDLTGQSGSFSVKWYDPRNGGSLQDGSIAAIIGGNAASIGLPPSATSNDWVAYVTKKDEVAPLRVLVYHETTGFRHGSIGAGIQMINDLGSTNNWTVEASQTSDIFNASNLATADVVIWMNTSGNDLLTSAEQAAFENFIKSGGGFVGVHAATDTYRNGSWLWYNELVGAIVQTNPNHTANNYNATMDVVGSHPAVSHLGAEWNKPEEYYYWELNGGFLYSGNIDLLRVRSTGSQTYDAPRPITWYKEYDGGRSFYTALGHNSSDYNSNSNFITMMEQAIVWAGRQTTSIASARKGNKEVDTLPENESLANVTLYPNPTEDVLVIKLTSKEPSTVQILDLSGKVLKEVLGEQEQMELDMTSIKAGIYLLEIEQGYTKKRFRVFKK